MASPTRWTWVWVSFRNWWWTGKPSVLQSMGLQKVGHNWASELNWTGYASKLFKGDFLNSWCSPLKRNFVHTSMSWKHSIFKLPWRSSGCDSSLSMQGTQVQSLVGYLKDPTCYQFSSVQFSHSVFPSVFPSIRVFSNESVLCIRWPKYWRFSFSISPSNKYSGLISLRIDWFDLLAVQRTLKSFLQYHMLSGPEKNKKSRNQSFLMIIRKCITVEVMFKESVVSFHDKCNIDIAYNNVSTLNPVKLFQ